MGNNNIIRIDDFRSNLSFEDTKTIAKDTFSLGEKSIIYIVGYDPNIENVTLTIVVQKILHGEYKWQYICQNLQEVIEVFNGII